MESLLLLAVLIFLAPFVIGGWAHVRAARLEREADRWRREIAGLRTAAAAHDEEIAGLHRQIRTLRGDPVAEDASFAEEDDVAADSQSDAEEVAAIAAASASASAETVSGEAAPPGPGRWRRWTQGGLERQFGAILPVWIGGIAIAFSGFFLVKYSIDNDLVGPELRVILGTMLGVALLAAARWLAVRVNDGNERIAQALAGAGIAVLYVSVYAATALYQLLPGFFGLVGMAAITGLAVILALRHGPPIALLGMVGGFVTPALFSSGEASAFLFFTYLYFVLAALMIIIRMRGWWLLSWPAVIFAFGWALLWIFSGGMAEGDAAWLGLFLVAVAGTVVTASRKRYEDEAGRILSWRDLFSRRNRALALNVVSVAGAMGLMAVLAFNASFGLHEWLLFAVLAVGAVALAFFDPRLYGFAPWAAMAINAVMLAGWFPDGGDAGLIIGLAGFGTLYVASGFLLVSSAATPLLWSALSASAALGYFLVAFFRLMPARPPAPPPHPIDIAPSREPVEPLVEGIKETAAAVPHVWAVLAMGLALVFLAAALWAARRLPHSIVKERVLAVYALATTAFVALTFVIELDREFLSVAIAAELLAVAWIATKTSIPSMRAIAALLGIAFGFLLLPQILLLLQLSAYSIIGIEWHLQDSIPIVDYPTFQLGSPAVLFLIAAYVLRRGGDGLLIRVFEFAALALIALWGFYTTAGLFHPGEDVLFAEAGFLERGVVTNVLFVFGLACLVIGRMFARIAFFQSGILLVGIALFRILYFDMLMKNPLWFGGEVVGITPFDALTVTFALPIVWMWFAADEIERQTANRWLLRAASIARGLTVVLAFAWLSFEIRKLYHGNFLDAFTTTDAEFYSYSAAWLLFGVALLFYGTLKGSQLLRYASLAILLLTVSKVFLLDADNLTGLYRVFSFLGLGLSLLGISYFYGRFVFGNAAAGDDTESGTA